MKISSNTSLKLRALNKIEPAQRPEMIKKQSLQVADSFQKQAVKPELATYTKKAMLSTAPSPQAQQPRLQPAAAPEITPVEKRPMTISGSILMRFFDRNPDSKEIFDKFIGWTKEQAEGTKEGPEINRDEFQRFLKENPSIAKAAEEYQTFYGYLFDRMQWSPLEMSYRLGVKLL